MIQPTQSSSVTHGGEALFLVEGTFSELQVARTTVNLLAQIEKNSQAKNLVSGVAGVTCDMHGMVANAAALALYDGEDMYNFAAALDEHIVCGTLQHADQFKNGEPVKAVVSKRGDVLYVHAIMHAQTQQFYTPLNVFAGKKAFFKSCMRVAYKLAIGVSLFFLMGSYFLGAYDTESGIDATKQLLIALFFISGTFIVCFLMEVCTYRTFRHNAEYATAIFTVLGFPNPNDIDLIRGYSINFEIKGWERAWKADLLLQTLNAE